MGMNTIYGFCLLNSERKFETKVQVVEKVGIGQSFRIVH